MKIDLKDCTLRIQDGTTVPNKITVKIGDGNVSFSEYRNREYALDRGKLDTVRDGDQQPVEVKFEIQWEWLKADTAVAPTPRDALLKINNASTWKTSDSDACAPYAVDIILEHIPVCADGTKAERITFPDFRVEQIDGDPKSGQLSITGKCNVTSPIIERYAITT